MFDFLRREGDSSNTVIGIIMLIMLLVFVGPNVLPSLLASTFPFIDEGVPCTFLRTGQNRANNQSWIGRSAVNPLSLRTQVDPLPDLSSPDGTWIIRITVQNNTIGTVPFVFDENQVIVGDDGVSSGIGLTFTPAANLSTGNVRTNQGIQSFPETSIRLLGPRQRCVHRVTFPASQLAAVQSGITQVTSYYRITTAGTVGFGIFPDQGLAIIAGGIVRSPAVNVPVSVVANDVVP